MGIKCKKPEIQVWFVCDVCGTISPTINFPYDVDEDDIYTAFKRTGWTFDDSVFGKRDEYSYCPRHSGH